MRANSYLVSGYLGLHFARMQSDETVSQAGQSPLELELDWSLSHHHLLYHIMTTLDGCILYFMLQLMFDLANYPMHVCKQTDKSSSSLGSVSSFFYPFT